MSPIAFMFLACSMCMTIVACEQISIPDSVLHPDAQCVLQGYLGSCSVLNHMLVKEKFSCKILNCAAPLRRRPTHRAVDIEGVADGTHCGSEKVCYRGSCIDLPAGRTMPEEIARDKRVFQCHKGRKEIIAVE